MFKSAQDEQRDSHAKNVGHHSLMRDLSSVRVSVCEERGEGGMEL